MRLTKTDNHGRVQVYEIDTSNPNNMLGFGATGRVFKGYRLDDNLEEVEPVAIKFLYADLNQTAIERARREAEIRLYDKNLVKMIDFIDNKDDSGNHHYHVVSELLDGVMLLDFIKGEITNREGITSNELKELYDTYKKDRVKFAIYITRNMLSGIQALHNAGYIHRDIDPSNVMITLDGTVKLLDYGIAKNLSSMSNQPKLTTLGNFIGKPKYAAPELVSGDLSHQDYTTDLYAVGIVLYQLLVGSVPFNGTDAEILTQQLTAKMPLNNIKNKQLRSTVEKATEKIQNKRYQTASEFIMALSETEKTSKITISQTGLWWITGIAILIGFIAGIIGGIVI